MPCPSWKPTSSWRPGGPVASETWQHRTHAIGRLRSHDPSIPLTPTRRTVFKIISFLSLASADFASTLYYNRSCPDRPAGQRQAREPPGVGTFPFHPRTSRTGSLFLPLPKLGEPVASYLQICDVPDQNSLSDKR
ncbi:hypothetical protein J6590_047357 [Homalodisca vitripennis]|nr:hypothetical protein J6590_047357 [Homalodisca vitripennis]